MKTQQNVEAWLAGRLPAEWFTGPVEVLLDRDEITVVGPLAAPTTAEGAEPEAVEIARRGRVTQFREDTRSRRIEIAREIEAASSRKVSWGVDIDGQRVMFTTHAAPVMTRLRQQERAVLDTLIDAGVAKSRSEALAWCVRLVGERSQTWLSDLREAMEQVEQVRSRGPEA